MAEIWFRVFYRNGKSEPLLGEAELARVLGRRTPIVVHHEIALIHRCQQCGTEGPWTKDWLCYPVLARHAEHIQAKATGEEYIVCSAACWDELLERTIRPPEWMDCNREPRRSDREKASALYRAISDDRRRQSEARDYRKVPIPNDRDNGRCKWCNEPMRESDKPRRMWHARCAEQFLLHSDLSTQLRFLRKRDGAECAMPGCTNRGGEVDHRRPLWSVRHLPPMIRRVFYGPRNLWLLCAACHAAKTKREAAQRAQERAKGKRPRGSRTVQKRSGATPIISV